MEATVASESRIAANPSNKSTAAVSEPGARGVQVWRDAGAAVPWAASRGRREALDLDLIRLLQRLGQVPGRLEPIPSIGTAAEGLVEANRHLG